MNQYTVETHEKEVHLSIFGTGTSGVILIDSLEKLTAKLVVYFRAMSREVAIRLESAEVQLEIAPVKEQVGFLLNLLNQSLEVFEESLIATLLTLVRLMYSHLGEVKQLSGIAMQIAMNWQVCAEHIDIVTGLVEYALTLPDKKIAADYYQKAMELVKDGLFEPDMFLINYRQELEAAKNLQFLQAQGYLDISDQ